jgi:hypothetical protein
MPSSRKRPSQTVLPPHLRRPAVSNHSPTLRQRFEQHRLQIAAER